LAGGGLFFDWYLAFTHSNRTRPQKNSATRLRRDEWEPAPKLLSAN
jgi:hypothetical protein